MKRHQQTRVKETHARNVQLEGHTLCENNLKATHAKETNLKMTQARNTTWKCITPWKQLETNTLWNLNEG